jgi:UDP-N-acetylglucosamine:LPS N-acetylglucosamine transferase
MTGEIPYNLYMRQDYSIVFDNEASASIIAKTKQSKANIILTGYRAKDEFLSTRSKYISKETAREKLKETFKEPIFNQISTKKTTIIIAGGGGGIIQKTKGFLKKLAQFQKRDISLLDRFQFFIVCGQNEKYHKSLLKLRKTRLSWQNIFPFGWLNSEQYALLQKSSDYPILYGIAPATMHELMTNECVPLLIHRIRADHELRNVEFVEDRGIGKYLKKDSDLIKDIFSNKYFLEKQKYIKNSEILLHEEEDRLTIFSEVIYDTLQRKTKPIYKIYQTNFQHKLFSSMLSGIFIVVYYLRRGMYKLTGIFPSILKKFPKDF